MFLKSIILQGFKSFANRTVINFESDYTGIVGPNGCGKSNIIDAIRWVLGEQSAKNMRGSQMSDVVFAGSQDKKGVSYAEVTLVFDNSKHLLNSEYQELEVTRKLYRDTNESIYLINNQEVRLKDIIDLTLDTGLSKDSLSVISQGTIQTFAEAKPLDRRALFEEAAGVAKYKKRKIESLNKLARTQENIDRLTDILNELEKQVSPLKKQAIKAKQYKELKEKLTEIEVAVIVNDVKNYDSDLETIEKQLFDFNYQETSAKASINVLDNEINDLKDEINQIDNNVQKGQDDLLVCLNDIQVLEKRKSEIEERRKYIKQTGNDQAKINELKNQMQESLSELNDREDRKNKLEASIDLINQQIEQQDENLTKLRNQIEKDTAESINFKNRQSVLENIIKSPFENQNGIKSIINNKKSLSGILDVVSECFIVDDGYQLMASTALGAAMFYIVTTDDIAARNAIKFLKKNKMGNATFLPMNILKPRYVNQDHLFIAEHTDGFLGIASDFVDCDEKYDGVVLSLLGNILVTDNLDNGNALAKRLNYGYKIVTVDGDVIYKGGTLSGGYNKVSDSPFTYQKQLDDVTKKISDLEIQISANSGEFANISKERFNNQQQLIELKLSLASLNEIISIKKAKYESDKTELAKISVDDISEGSDFDNELISSLNKAYGLKDSLTNMISSKRERRIMANNEYQRKYNQLKQLRNQLSDVINQINESQISKAKIIANKDNQLERLARDYTMTYEYASSLNYEVDLSIAKNEVVDLRQQITDLGNVNLDAPESYEEVNSRYEFMNKQLTDLNQAKDKLLDVINEMDEVMTSQFSDMFSKINEQLPKVFTVLFGGGNAKLILEDPDDILNTGIDIDVQPPGKKVQNIRLFSGGEKCLIALCVLFAILKARPVPLCIFDEVEASLDQSNVDKFAKYIHQFANESQFLVITHRPGTMTECDVLYGITMQQKGISNVLKVKLKEALSFASEDK